jgi:hypothetical protein
MYKYCVIYLYILTTKNMPKEMFKILSEKSNKLLNLYHHTVYTEMGKEIVWLLSLYMYTVLRNKITRLLRY